MKKVLGVILILVVAAAVIFFLLNQGDTSELVRLRFQPMHPQTETERVSADLESEMKESIPTGDCFRFNGQLDLFCRPGRKGEQGFFFTFSVRSLDAQKVKTSIGLKRRGRITWLKHYLKKRYYHSFSSESSLFAEDEFVIRVEGDGVLAVNRPVIYDLAVEGDRKYVFVIALDTLRYDRVGAARNGVPITPAISRFRDDSVEFVNTYAQSNWTLPSFMSLFTGLYEFNHQITRFTRLETHKPFLIEDIAAKYFTVNFNAGLWLQGKFGFSRGFDYFSVFSSPKDSWGGKKLFAKAVEFLKNNHPPALLMFLHTYQIHSPFAPPEQFLKQINPSTGHTNLDSFFYQKQFRTDIATDVRLGMEELYDAEILAFDHFFEDFIQSLRELGIYDQSLIVFLSDHGEEFFEHHGWAHCHSLYEEVIRVPLYFKFPQQQYKGMRVTENAGLIDVFPTLLDYTDLPSSAEMDGESLLPLLRNQTMKRRLLLSSTSAGWLVKQIPPRFSILNGRLKLISRQPYSDEAREYFAPFGGPPETNPLALYDLKADPLEKNTLEGQSKQKALAGLIDELNRMKRLIPSIMKKKRQKNITISEEERRKLESLGYL